MRSLFGKIAKIFCMEQISIKRKETATDQVWTLFVSFLAAASCTCASGLLSHSRDPCPLLDSPSLLGPPHDIRATGFKEKGDKLARALPLLSPAMSRPARSPARNKVSQKSSTPEGLLLQGFTALESLNPPSAIHADWQHLLERLEQLTLGASSGAPKQPYEANNTTGEAALPLDLGSEDAPKRCVTPRLWLVAQNILTRIPFLFRVQDIERDGGLFASERRQSGCNKGR
jgi:hypothetical protein